MKHKQRKSQMVNREIQDLKGPKKGQLTRREGGECENKQGLNLAIFKVNFPFWT